MKSDAVWGFCSAWHQVFRWSLCDQPRCNEAWRTFDKSLSTASGWIFNTFFKDSLSVLNVFSTDPPEEMFPSCLINVSPPLSSVVPLPFILRCVHVPVLLFDCGKRRTYSPDLVTEQLESPGVHVWFPDEHLLYCIIYWCQWLFLGFLGDFPPSYVGRTIDYLKPIKAL